MKAITEEQEELIKNNFLNIKSINDLLYVINETAKLLNWKYDMSEKDFFFCIQALDSRYKQFSVKKKTGGERVINAPIAPLLSTQKVLNFILSLYFEPHHKAMGFVKGKCVVDNAQFHLGKNYVYNIDLKDFFHSFERKQIKQLFMRKPFNFLYEREDIAFALANLCTFWMNFEGEKKAVLPQGAPTSPILTNILCKRMDFALDKLAKKI